MLIAMVLTGSYIFYTYLNQTSINENIPIYFNNLNYNCINSWYFYSSNESSIDGKKQSIDHGF